ncbi:MAG: KEOPS complex kinase/ATPase Bud32 [Candidatus Nanohaloarchaea archaeon]
MKKFEGAEAEVRIGEEDVKKERHAKKYRHEKIDEELRHDRTETEQKLMEDARRHGVNVPEAEKEESNQLRIEKVEGSQLKEVIADRPESLKELGENIALLHDTGIIHGDLTTSNAVVNEEPYLIDFGLSYRSQRIEDRAVDIHLLKQVLKSSHPEVAEEAWKEFVEGYREYEKSEEVLEQLEDVESRGRYK